MSTPMIAGCRSAAVLWISATFAHYLSTREMRLI